MVELSRIVHFLATDIWRLQLHAMPRPRSFVVKHLRILILTVRRFGEDKCQLRASALTFFTLLSIVPVLAVAFGVARGFHFDQLLEKQLLEQIPGQEESLRQVIRFARTLLDNTRGGVIAGIGVAMLFWSVLKVLGNIEQSFNDIWGVEQSRPLGRKFADYLSALLVCPLLLVIAGSATVFISSRVGGWLADAGPFAIVGPIVSVVLKLLPFSVVWILFTFIYVFMPNTKVAFRSGVFSGIVAGTVYQTVQWVYVTFQVNVASYNAIYGTFAALPLFLIWLQVSWLIVLFGAEVCFAHQNVQTYEFEPDSRNLSQAFHSLISLYVTHFLVKRFAENAPALTDTHIAHSLKIPIRLVRQTLHGLVQAGILSEVKVSEYKAAAYQPARNIETLSICDILDAQANLGSGTIPLIMTPELKSLRDALTAFRETLHHCPANTLLKNV